MKKASIDLSNDFRKALLWQYEEFPELKTLADQKDTWYQDNHVAFWENWITDVFDIRTCGDFGLVIWGIILGTPLHVNVGPQPLRQAFGFGSYNLNFRNSNFITVRQQAVRLSKEQKRTLLLLRYNQLTGKCTVPFINKVLKTFFGQYGNIYIIDTYDMSDITVYMEFVPSTELWFILKECDVLLRPAGVGVKYVVNNVLTIGGETITISGSPATMGDIVI